jgi:hypothetical protein
VVLTSLEDMEREVAAAAARVRLLDALGVHADASAVTILAQRPLGDLVVATAHAGFYSTAARLAVAAGTGLTVVAELLARCCLALERDPLAPFSDEENPAGTGTQPAAAAWTVLRELLERFDGAATNFAAHTAATTTLLGASAGALPSWLHTAMLVRIRFCLVSVRT